ncbi:low temperature-induced protein [Capilliphycus salinus ALCB114379]|uniref:low temperature-induced protein n=1 Tax=Capilliphycus salinus TaxID=2768948 RepID=UPI0039A42315
MKNILMRLTRIFVAVCVCLVLVVSHGIPAMAAANSTNNQGEDALKDIQKKSEDVLRTPPRSLDQSKADAPAGLNLVQGEANRDDMKRPQTSSGTSVEQQIDEGLKKTFGR